MKDFKRTRILWSLGIIAPLWFTAATVLTGLLTPGYSPVSEVVSELGAKGRPYAALMNYGGFMATGIMIVLFSQGARRMLGRGRLAGIACTLIALTGIGVFGTGLFQCDPGCSLEGASVEMIAHSISGIVTFAFSAIAPLVLALHEWRSHRRRGFIAYSLLTGVVLITLLCSMFSPVISGYRGLHQGAFLAVFFSWILIFGLSNRP